MDENCLVKSDQHIWSHPGAAAGDGDGAGNNALPDISKTLILGGGEGGAGLPEIHEMLQLSLEVIELSLAHRTPPLPDSVGFKHE